MFAASILPLSTAYYVCEAFGRERGIDKRPVDPVLLTEAMIWRILRDAVA